MGRLQKQVVGVGLRRVNAVIAACVCLLNSSTTAQPVRACVNALAVNQPINSEFVTAACCCADIVVAAAAIGS